MPNFADRGSDRKRENDQSLQEFDVEQTELRKLLRKIAELQATYASELANFTSLRVDEVSGILYELEDAGVLERISPTIKHADPRLLHREGASNGTRKGIEEVRQPNWFGLNSDREWAMHDSREDVWYDEMGNRRPEYTEGDLAVESNVDTVKDAFHEAREAL